MAWELSDEQKKIANKVSSKRKNEEPQKNNLSSAKGTWELSDGQKEIARNVASRYAGQAQNTYKNMSSAYNAAINRIAGGSYLDRQERTDLRRQLYDLEGDVGRLQSYFNTQNDGGAFSGDIQMLKEASDTLAGAHESLDFWSQFESEDDYSTYLSQREEYERLSKFDFDQAEKQLEALNLQLEAKQKEIPPILRTGALGAGGARQLSANDAEIDAIKQQIAELQREYKQATNVQQQNKYAAYANNEDFKQYSAMGAAIENPSIEEWGKGNTNIFGWKPFASEEREVKNKVSFGRDNYNQLVAGVQSNSSPEIGYLLYNSMTDDEVATYNYILAKEGAESADAYLSHLEETLNYRMGNQQATSIEGIDSSALRGGAKALYGVGAGLDQWVSGTRQLFTPEELPTSATQFGSAAIRESLSDDWAQLPEWLGGDTLAQAAYDAITTTANMAPSILLGSFVGGLGAPAAVSKAVSGVALGASAKGNAYNQALKDGYTQQEARNYSTLIGASEAALSYVLGGIGKLGGIATNKAAQAAIRNIDNALLRIAANVGINMAGEGFEEYLQEILEPVYRNLCFNENNEFRIFTEEAAYSFLLGSLTAAFMEGGSNISSGISANKLGKMIQEAGNVDALLDSAFVLDPNSEAFGLAQRMKDGKLHVNSSNLGDLLTAYKEAGGTSDFLAEIPADAAQETAPAQADELREAAMDAAIAQEHEAEQATPASKDRASMQAQLDRRSAPAEPSVTVSPGSNQTERTSVNMRQASQPQEKVVATRQRAAFNDSGAELEVTGVSSVENGNLYVSIDSGGTAAVEDISFDDPRVDALYANAATFDTQTAKAFISGYDGSSDVGTYYSGFASIYGAARSGKSMQQAISNSLHASGLSLEAQQLAYHAGVNAGPITDAKIPASSVPQATRAVEEARPASPPRSVSNQQRPVAPKKGAGVVREFRGGIDAEQDKSLRVLDAVAKAIGRKVHVVDSITRGADGAPALNATDAKGSIIEGSTNAYFDEETNEYYISLGGVGQAYMYFALHESVHDIAKNNALGYENLERIVFEILESKSADIASMMDVQRRLYPNEDDAYLRQEIVANTVPAILTDKATADAFLDRVMGADADTRTAFEKLLDSIRDFLKKTYDALKGQKSWQQMELIKGDLDAIDRIREAYFAALEDMQGQDASKEESGTPSSEPRGFAAEYDAWDGKNANKRFFVGKTPSSLKYVGVKDQEIVWDASKIIKIKQEHAAMTDEIIKQVPSVIESPILVMESKTVPGRITMLGELSDANGAPVLVALELEPAKDHRLTMDVIKIASAYGKDSNPQKFIDDSRILFVEPDKKRTHTWLKLYKLRLPSSVKYGLNGRVSYKKPSVKGSVRDGGPGDARPTMKDSQGNDLSAQQAEYFKDSKVRDENGNLLVMYHGTPYGGFSQFRPGTYFTQKEWLAETYHSPSASSIRGKYDPATNPMTYAVYLDMRKPFDTRNAKERRIFEKEYYQQYGMGTPLMESGLPDWFDGSDLMEFIEEKGYDYDGLILDEGGMGGYGEEVISRGLSYVIFDPAQAKSTDNKAPTSSPNMRFSMIDPVEETDDLIAVHNLTGDTLAGVLELGGFPMPSIAVLRASQGHERYGDISVIFGKDTINPGTNRQNKVYGGDAWTPTFPRIEFEVNAKEAAKIRKRVYGVAGGYATLHELGSINLDEDNLETDLNRYDGDAVRMFSGNVPMKYAYLRDTGAEYELPMKTETLGKYSGHDNSVIQGVLEELGADLLDELMDAGYARYKADTELIERLLHIINAAYGGKSNFKELGFSQYDNLLRDARKHARNGATIGEEIDYSAARSQIGALVPQAEYEAWLRELFGDIIKSRGIRNNADYFTPSGNRRSFAALHWAVTLDNIVKAMKGGIGKGGGMFGGNSIFGLATKDYKSISDIKADVSRLRVASEDEYAEIKEAYQQRLLEIADEIKPPSERNSFIALDNSVEALLDAVRRGKSKAGIARVLNNEYKGYYNIQSDTAQKIYDLVQDIYEMPTEYFEAKPERAVGLDEIRAVIMPRGEYEDIRARLQQRNIPIEEYDPGTEGDRLRALNSEPARKWRFSLKDTAHVSSAALETEVARKDQMIADLKAQFKLTEGHRVSDKALEKLARRVLKEYSSEYSMSTLQENLRTMFDYIANAEQPVWDDIVSMGTGMAKAIIKQSSELDTTMYEYYADARDYLRNTRISLSSTQRSEAAYTVGSYREYRQSLFGSVNLTNDGVSLDSVWGELSEMHPEIFDPDATEGDMVPALLNAVDAMKPVYRNPYGYDMDGAAYDLFLRLYDEYFDIPEVKTFADKKAAELAKVKARYSNRIAEIREDSKAKRDALLREIKEANKAHRLELSNQYNALREEERTLVGMVAGRVKAEERNRRLQQVRKLKEQAREKYRRLTEEKNEQLLVQRYIHQSRMEEYRKRRDMSDKSKRYKARIESNAKTLYSWLLHPTDAKHVPEALRKIVSDFLLTIDFAGDKTNNRAIKWREAMRDLKDAMQKAGRGDADYTDFYADIDPDFIPRLEMFIDTNRAVATVADMNVEQLRELDFLVAIVKRSVTEANRLHANARYKNIEQAGGAAVEEMDRKKASKPRGKLGEMVNNLLDVGQLDSFSYFDQLGNAAKSVLESLRAGMDTKVRNTGAAMEYMQDVLKGVDAKKLSGRGAKLHTFQVAGGELKLTTAQIMELYLLNQREQARGHIYGGGIKPVDTDVRQGRKTLRLRNYRPVKVNEEDVKNITSVLTPAQRKIADSMQRFLGGQAANWGNEVSMTLYGYKKFTEENYYPIKSDDNYTKTQDPDAGGGLYALRNLGMTKGTVKGANNPLLLGDIFDTFTQHVDDMATYNAFVVPLSDAMKWFNFRDRESGASIKQSIERVLGKSGKQYFINLIKDINGVNSGSYSSGLSDALLRNAKIASVGANMRVVLQQPTAYLRAAAMINPKYLAGAIFKKSNAAMARKFSPIAQWKSWGFFDLNLGRSMRELIIGDQTATQKIREGSLWMAGKADDITWGALWNACELETREKQPSLKPGTDEYNIAVGKRLSEIIDRTQVVDSVFHRSQLMRSKNGLVQLYTSFMSEPTKSYNMLRNAAVEWAENKSAASAGKFARVAVTFVATSIATSAFAAVADAFRDDDDEKDWGEKWLAAFTGNTAENINPLTLIPGVKDVLSMLDGYSASRMDLQAVERIINSADAWMKYLRGESKWNAYKLIYQSASAISSLTGIPIGNAMRTFNSLYNTFSENGIDWESETSTVARSYETLYSAITEGDTEKRDQLRADFLADRISTITASEQERIAEGKTPLYADSKSIEAAARIEMENNLANVLMSDPKIATAYQYRKAGDANRLMSLYRELEKLGYTSNEITKAINKYANLTEGSEAATKGYEHIAVFDRENLFAAIRDAAATGDYSDIAIIREELIETSNAKDPVSSINEAVATEFRDEYLGYMEQGDAYKAAGLAAVLEDEFGYDQEDRDRWLKSAYSESVISGDAYSQRGLENAMLETGFNEDTIDELKQSAIERAAAEEFWAAYPEYEGYTVDAVNTYQKYGPALGISAGDFFDAWDFRSAAKADVDDDGKAISGSKKEKVLAYIDGMALTPEQKDAFYYLFGYAESTIGDAPWR